jgi:rhodanese-related sulfurtransferase
MQFVLHNWYLFLALIVVLALLAAPIVMQQIYGIKSLAPARCVLLINRESAVVVDVSEVGEYNAGHIPNALNVPIAGFSQGAATLDKYKERPVIVVSRNNQRALKAATALRKRGFASVSLLAGGFAAWEKENLPLEK